MEKIFELHERNYLFDSLSERLAVLDLKRVKLEKLPNQKLDFIFQEIDLIYDILRKLKNLDYGIKD